MITKLSKIGLIITHNELKKKTVITVSNEGINKTFLKPIITNKDIQNVIILSQRKSLKEKFKTWDKEISQKN